MENNHIPEEEQLALTPEEIAGEGVPAEGEYIPAFEAAPESDGDLPSPAPEKASYQPRFAMADTDPPSEKSHTEELPENLPDPDKEESESPAAAPAAPFDLSVIDDPELDGQEQAAEETAEVGEDFTEEEPAPQPPFRDQEFRDAFGDGEEFDEIMNAPAAETPIPSHNRPTRKGRPKRRKGEFLFGIPQLAVTAVWLAIILVVGVTLGRMLWACAADVLAFGREDKPVTVTIYESDTIEDVTNKLHQAGLIRYPGLFKLYADLAVDEGEIAPGIWDLNTNYDYHALVNMMSPRSNRPIVEDLLIPEGYTCRQIFALLEENKICTAKDISEYAASGELKDYWFLSGIQRGEAYCLEGFLFPDTYDFYQNSSPREVLEKMLDNFDHRFTEEMRGQIDTLNTNVTGGTFSIHEVVIVASMIEKETANNEESPVIASVIYNRLFNWGSTPAFLNIDASIVYALNGKTDLTTADLQIDHPYNTYKNIGLTPGAISNPGLASLKAALNPSSTNYYYYVLNPATGKHQFSTTLAEHEGYVAQFREG